MLRYSLITGAALAVFAAATAPFLLDSPSARDIQWSGEEYCARAIASLPAAVRGHACIDVRTHPRTGAQLPPWVTEGSAPNACVTPSDLL